MYIVHADFTFSIPIMDGNCNNDGQRYSPRPPQQYFTSGSRQGYGTPPSRMTYNSSTPTMAPRYHGPRVQRHSFGTPGDGSPYGSPYSDGHNHSSNRLPFSPTPRYTPSPVHPRPPSHYQNYGHSPNTSYGRGGPSFRGRGGRVGLTLTSYPVLLWQQFYVSVNTLSTS